MSTRIFEELPSRKDIPVAAPKRPERKDEGRKEGAAGGGGEKRIRQAVYDIRYRARREEIPLMQAFSQYMQNTSMSGAERQAVKAKLSEEYVINEMATDNIATAMFKVFVEGVEEEVEELEYLQQLAEMDERKYKVRVTDKKSGKSYVRYATRQKISELRANPNIQSVEMTEYGEPYEGERKKGERTAKAKAGKGLDPVGKEDSDVNNDGKVDKTDDYLMKRRKAIGSAIASRKENYDMYEAVSPTVDQNERKITGEGTDNYSKRGKGRKAVVNLYPSVEPAGGMQTEEFVSEKAVSTAQQKFMGMVLATKRGMKAPSPEVAQAASGMSSTEAEKFASTKHEGLPKHVRKEEVELDECGMPVIAIKKDSSEKSNPNMTSDLKNINPDDPRATYSKVAKVKNTLRSMGLKMSYEPDGSVISEREWDEPGEREPAPQRRERRNRINQGIIQQTQDRLRAAEERRNQNKNP